MNDEGKPIAARATLAKRVRFLLHAAALISLLGFVGGAWMPLELTTHFRPHCALLLGAGALWLSAQRRWWHLLPVLLAAALNAAVVLPWYFAMSDPQPTAPATQIRLLLANVHTANLEHGLILEQIAREDPDIVILQETDDRWLASLAPLKERYPHHVEVPRGDNFGIALYSRLELADLHITDFSGAHVPSITGVLHLNGAPVTLIATHPVPPIRPTYFDWRNEQLAAVARFATDQSRTIVIGDLNVTMWSPYHTNFERQSGLRNVRRGRGILPTWPVGLGPLMIPLDHCFVSPDITVGDLRAGQPTGADHLPLIVELAL